MITKGLTVGLLQENCYVLGCETTGSGVIIDPGDEARAILAVAKEAGLTIEKIINTHAHFDHVMAVNGVKAQTGATFHLHELDLPILRDAPDRVALWLSMEIDPVDDPDEFLTPGQTITFGEESLEVRFVPGHAPGHVVFVHKPSHVAIVGDVLFAGSIGRTDFPRGDHGQLLVSITQKLWPLGDDITFIPGHGPNSTFGQERRTNPFVADSRFG